MAPVAELDDPLDTDTVGAFSVLKQKLYFDFSFSPRCIKGKTTIEIQPQDENLRVIQLNCRQLDITAVKVEGHDASKTCYYSNLYPRLSLYPGTGIHQHHYMRSRLQRHVSGAELELEIVVPDAVKIRRMDPEDATADQVAANGFGADGDNLYTPLKVEIEYLLENPRDAIQFVGVEDGDARYPHAYTRNSPYPGMASSLFPCIDDGTTKSLFDVSVRYPRTVGDVYSKARPSAGADAVSQDEHSPKADSVMGGIDDDPAELTEEERALEMAVICSGELTDDISDTSDPTRKTASFTCAVPVLPQHIGIAVGPFVHVDLSDYRDTQDDERLGSNAIRVHGFCLPEKEDEVRNSAMMLARTLDSFTEKYQSYPFEKAYKLAFVDDLDCDVAHSASFSICSSRLLFPETVWEPLENTTRVLVHAVASQWIGVNVTPQRPNDHWVIIGSSWFMAELYLRELFGRNDFRFRQKMVVDRIIQLDVRRPSLFILGEYLSVDPGELEFMVLKAPMVLAILHHRLVKQSGKNGVDRCLYRLLFNVRNEKLPNGVISTEAFLDICEKVGHQKLDTFFNQWVFGSGCPTFECHPVFNKKKQVIQLTIKQTQADPTMRVEERLVAADELLREAKEKANGFRVSTEWPAFVGPMTIRIHEADGTPYEHIVDINSSTVKVEIPYNTKYKRIKKSRLEKERTNARVGYDANGEAQDEPVFYMLGDVLESEREAQEWRISEWSQEDLQRMDNEFYEWMRIDADFEWICRANINDMPSYMYVSQLQQDKDVKAQAESIQWLAMKEGHPLISSILVKTLMDGRYFHGIRTMAADVISLSAKKELNWIGLFHLKKAFQELFCIPGSPMTRSNDFSDRVAYIIQCAIPKAISRVKGADGRAPLPAKRFLLDAMRYNDNRGNEYSDDHYLATLMQCLAQSLSSNKKTPVDHDPTLGIEEENEEFDFRTKALEELSRHQRLDEWIPTYHNIYTTTALDCSLVLTKNKELDLASSEFLKYTRVGNADNVRLKAWECLMNLGMIRKSSVAKYMVQNIATDTSPYFRAALIRIFETAIGQVAIGEEFKQEKAGGMTNGGLVIEQEEALPDREAQLARRRLDGAVRAMKVELSGDESLAVALEQALRSTTTSIRDVAALLEICSFVYYTKNTLPITLHYRKYWVVEHIGQGRLRFYHSNKYRTQLPKKPEAPKPPESQVKLDATSQPQPPKQTETPMRPPLPPISIPPAVPIQVQPQQQTPAPRPEPPPRSGSTMLKLKIKAPTTPQITQPAATPTMASPSIVTTQTKRPSIIPLKPPTPAAEPKLASKKPNKARKASPTPSAGTLASSPSTISAPPSQTLPPPPLPTPVAIKVAKPAPPPTMSNPITEPAPPVERGKKKKAQHYSLICTLKISPEKLAKWTCDSQANLPVKRKAEHAPEGPQRALKRQASEEPLSRLVGRKQKTVKLRYGKHNVGRLPLGLQK